MSHFYGTLNGRAKTQATRCGSKNSGITTYAASWQGAVKVREWHNGKTGIDMCEVSLTRWHGAGVSHVLYYGPIGEYKPLKEHPVIEGIERELNGVDVDDLSPAEMKWFLTKLQTELGLKHESADEPQPLKLTD